jgi:hypothetical protein
LIPVRYSADKGLALLPLVIVGIAITTNLLVAIAPATKIDELNYHMLVPSRIMADGALQFYREPWAGAILPQMVFQISTAPLHAIGYPDAGGVVSWSLSITLLWFAWHIINESAKPVAWTYLWVTTLFIGLYSVVWQVTGGSHAMGDLATAAAIVALCLRRQLLAKLGPTIFAGMFSILLLSSASSKISLLPLSIALLLFMSWSLLRSVGCQESWRIVLAMLAPWVCLILPLALWTWWRSGSPFGPVLSEFFPSSVYDINLIQEELQSTRVSNQTPIMVVIRYALLNYSPLLWLGVLGALVSSELAKATRVTMASLLILQVILIYLFLPYDARFLGGIHYGLLIIFASSATNRIQNLFISKRAFVLVAITLLLPWLGLQIFYARQFFRISLGLQPKEEFYERYIAFYRDYKKLDRILPKDAVLLVTDFRLSAVYAPRPVFMNPADLPQNKESFFFGSPSSISVFGDTSPGYKLSETVYENSQAVAETHRTPGWPPVIEPLCVVKMVKD